MFVYVFMFTAWSCLVNVIHMFVSHCLYAQSLSIAYITNPWAPVKWITGPRRVTKNERKSLGRKSMYNELCYYKSLSIKAASGHISRALFS